MFDQINDGHCYDTLRCHHLEIEKFCGTNGQNTKKVRQIHKRHMRFARLTQLAAGLLLQVNKMFWSLPRNHAKRLVIAEPTMPLLPYRLIKLAYARTHAIALSTGTLYFVEYNLLLL